MRMIGVVVTLLLALPAVAADKPDELRPEQRKELEKKAVELVQEGFRRYQSGEFNKATELHCEVLEICRALYPKAKFPKGHPDLARSIHDLAFLQQATGEYGKAEPLCREALDMRRSLYPTERYPKGHADLARSINNLAGLHLATGEYGKAEPFYREALNMSRALYPKGQYPKGHADLAPSINNLAALHKAAGEYGKAESLYREALDMSRALYPKEQFPQGHPELARSIGNLALLYEAAGEHGKAERLSREALLMKRALYPKEQFPSGHANLALSINDLAGLHWSAREYGKAEPLFREALLMRRALFPKEQYPKGHPNLATSINNLAALYQDTGEYGLAEPLYREALLMCRALFPKEQFPKGHPDLARRISNLAGLYRRPGEYGKAVLLSREALAMCQQLLLRYADLAAEAECLNYLNSRPLTRDALLSASRHPPATGSIYDALWDSRAALTRLQERRHRDLMASRDKDTADLVDELRRSRLTLAHLLLSPSRDPAKQRAEVDKLTEAKEDLEKRIAAKLKLAPLQPVATSAAKQLIERLPEGAAFVDLYRYTDFEQDPNVPGKKGEKRPPRYAAFVLRRDKAVARVELKEAAPIDAAWAAWQQAITAARPGDKTERDAAARLAELVWKPLREALPAELKTVYLAPDGKLSQVPWAALPGQKPDTVLLDECAVCLVPHGPFLLERLQEKPAEWRGDTLLAYGGVDYDHDRAAIVKPPDDVRGPLLSAKKRLTWGDLPATAREQEQIVALARKALKDPPLQRSGRTASTRQLEEDLPRARYAHLATHGFFADPEFRSALQIDPKAFERISQDRRGGARSPLVLSGLVLAGANRQGDDAAPDRGIITAEGLIGLRLEGLELAVLSACETGLGEEGGGEGVYGLQRAFHVAGCQNVIASLWKVDDGATQALMALFYRNLWEKKLDPAEALRQAQLTLYRNPEAVQVAAKRGVDFSESDLPNVAEKPAAKPRRAPTAHWAAFTLSGVRPVLNEK